jgi:hypothetical protein
MASRYSPPFVGREQVRAISRDNKSRSRSGLLAAARASPLENSMQTRCRPNKLVESLALSPGSRAAGSGSRQFD